jgi:8-amino-7-oxononanoate synthase
MSKENRWQWMMEELEELKRRSQYRSLSDTALSEDDGWIVKDGRKMLNLASNHYLGLNQLMDTSMLEQLQRQAEQFGGGARIGAAASRLIVGSDPVYAQFEEQFASYKGTESCLVFGSGYMANLGVISSLVGRNDVVFSDRLNHASILDGITLSRAEHIRYRHRDIDHLESLLRKADSGKRKLIVTDTVFSMDGSIAPLRELVELKQRYGALLMVDEAHSGGVFGAEGQGLAHALGLTEQVDVHMGTFSKAYGCYGAYVAGDALLKEYLVNKARSFIFTTALPPIVILTIMGNWRKVKREPWRRDRLHERSAWFRRSLRKLGFDTGESECQIVPILIGDNERAVAFSRLLQEAGIAAVAIRPPTVPEGTARIRFTLMSTHTDEDLQWAVDTIGQAGRQTGIL